MKRATLLAAAVLSIAPISNAQNIAIARAAPSAMSLPDRDADIRSTPVTRAEFQSYIDILKLDETTADIARDMYEGFRADNAAMATAHQERMAELVRKAQESGDHSAILSILPKMSEERTKKTEELRDTFLSDLKLLLTDDQAARWPLVDQHRRRARVQSQLHVSGADVDLIALAHETIDNVPASLQSQFDTYAKSLDRLLLDLVDLRTKRANAMDLSTLGNADAQEEMREISDKRREISIAIRDLNDRTLRLVSVDLNAEQRAAITDAFKLAAFPRVYTPSYADNSLRAALAIASLDDAQRSELEALQAGHAKSAATLNLQWERAIRENDEDPDAGMFFAGPGGAMVEVRIDDDTDLDENTVSPLEKASDARTERDEQTLARLESILRSDQFASLPEKPKKLDPWDPANLPAGANAVFISTSVEVGPEGETTTSDVQILTPEDMKDMQDNQ